MNYTHKVIRISTGDLCSEHTSLALAEKAAARLNGMGKNPHAFRAEPMANDDPQASRNWRAGASGQWQF